MERSEVLTEVKAITLATVVSNRKILDILTLCVYISRPVERWYSIITGTAHSKTRVSLPLQNSTRKT